MRKIILSVLLSLMSIGFAFSQLDAQLSQYMLNPVAFNPAAVGEGNLIQVTGQGRLQWVGIPNAGKTIIFGINSPLKIGNSLSGFGINFNKYQIGLFIDQTFHFQYAYKKKLGKGILSVGADLGLIEIGFSGDSVAAHKITIGDYHKLSGEDPNIPMVKVSGNSFDVGLGALYTTPTYHIGLSYTHLNSPTVQWNKDEFTKESSLYLTGGCNFKLQNPKYIVKPSMLLKTDFSTYQVDVSSLIEYNNKYWGGISYRLQDAIVFLAGINIANGLSIGYSYDLPTSKIINASIGSHEVLLTYSFEYVSGKRKSKFKSIRIL